MRRFVSAALPLACRFPLVLGGKSLRPADLRCFRGGWVFAAQRFRPNVAARRHGLSPRLEHRKSEGKTLLFDRSPALAGLLGVILALAYLAFSGAASLGEAIFAIVAGVLATFATLAVMRLADMQEIVEARWLTRLARPLLDVVIEVVPLTAALCVALARRERLAAATETRDFEPGSAEDPRDRGRRALVTIAISLAPARLVIDSDVDAREIRTCRIGVKAMAKVPEDRRWPL